MKWVLVFLISISQVWAYNPLKKPDSFFLSKEYENKKIEKFAIKWSRHFGLPENIVFSVIDQESRWNHKATSHVNAKGLMQLMPATAKDLGLSSEESLYNPYTNIYYGCKYLSFLADRYEDDFFLVLVAYYSGMKWADYIQKGKLRDSDFRKEITGYAQEVLVRSISYMEVGVGREKIQAEEVNQF